MDVRLSPKEEELLALLREQPRTSTELIEDLFSGRPPFNARMILRGRMQTLSRKLEVMRNGVRVAKSERRGPYPITYRLVRR